MKNQSPELIETDWFASVMTYKGSVNDALESAKESLIARIDFVSALQVAFGDCSAGSDNVTDLLEDVEAFEKTLDFRLSSLSSKNEGSWFRSGVTNKIGPFGTKIDESPVFTLYDKREASELRRQLNIAFENGDCSVKAMRDGVSLWTKLLDLNSKYKRITTVNWRDQVYRLDCLPDGLDGVIVSSGVTGFLLNVRGVVLKTRKSLDQSFKRLYRSSNELWTRQASSTQQFDQSAKKKYHNQARRVRDDMSERRKAMKSNLTVSIIEKEALRFMSLDVGVSEEEIKRRYREMAKKLHPDCDGGSPEKFRYLNKMYKRLL